MPQRPSQTFCTTNSHKSLVAEKADQLTSRVDDAWLSEWGNEASKSSTRSLEISGHDETAYRESLQSLNEHQRDLLQKREALVKELQVTAVCYVEQQPENVNRSHCRCCFHQEARAELAKLERAFVAEFGLAALQNMEKSKWGLR